MELTTTGRLMTAAEVAQRLSYTERYVWKLGREGALARVKVPGRKYVRFSEDDVQRFVREGRQQLAPPRRAASAAAAPARPALPPRF